MSKKTAPKKVAKTKAVKAPKVKLLTYTLKAVIPTGQYANIQPEITVQAESMEQAERVVMPYIETLFARYREAGVLPIQTPLRPVVTPQNTPVGSKTTAPVAPTAPVAKAPVAAPVEAPKAPLGNPGPNGTVVPKGTDMLAPQAIVLSVPFTRAKSAIESCTSAAALKLVSDQVEKSTKLVDAEKVELRSLVAAKSSQLNVKP